MHAMLPFQNLVAHPLLGLASPAPFALMLWAGEPTIFFLQDIALQISSSQVRVVHSKQRHNRVDFDFAPAAINYRTEIRATASLKRGMCI